MFVSTDTTLAPCFSSSISPFGIISTVQSHELVHVLTSNSFSWHCSEYNQMRTKCSRNVMSSASNDFTIVDFRLCFKWIVELSNHHCVSKNNFSNKNIQKIDWSDYNILYIVPHVGVEVSSRNLHIKSLLENNCFIGNIRLFDFLFYSKTEFYLRKYQSGSSTLYRYSVWKKNRIKYFKNCSIFRNKKWRRSLRLLDKQFFNIASHCNVETNKDSHMWF